VYQCVHLRYILCLRVNRIEILYTHVYRQFLHRINATKVFYLYVYILLIYIVYCLAFYMNRCGRIGGAQYSCLYPVLLRTCMLTTRNIEITSLPPTPVGTFEKLVPIRFSLCMKVSLYSVESQIIYMIMCMMMMIIIIIFTCAYKVIFFPLPIRAITIYLISPIITCIPIHVNALCTVARDRTWRGKRN
jgi:hypothetical protein